MGKKAAWAEIKATRQRGYAISRAEFSFGVMTLAAPIFDGFGNVQMVLQCPGLIDRVIENEATIAAELRRSAERLNAILGGSARGWRRARLARPIFNLDGASLVATLPKRILFYIENN